jgi:hypothetical protein
LSIGTHLFDVVTIPNLSPSIHAICIEASAIPTTGVSVISLAPLIDG